MPKLGEIVYLPDGRWGYYQGVRGGKRLVAIVSTELVGKIISEREWTKISKKAL